MAHVWLVFLTVVAVNLAIMWRRIPARCGDPGQATVARQLALGFAVWSALPFVVIGFGTELGGVPMDQFLSASSSPYVLAFKGLVVIEIAVASWWIWRGGGAESIARHAWMFRGNVTSATGVRIVWVMMVFGVVAALITSFVRQAQ